MTLYSEFLDRLLSSRTALMFWAAALVFDVVSRAAISFGDGEQETSLDLILLGAILWAGSFWFQWHATRAIGGATASQPGDVVRWLLWLFIIFVIWIGTIWAALFVGIVSIVGWDTDIFGDLQTSPLFIVANSAVLSLAFPILVHASGRAIDADGPSFIDTVDRCRPMYFQLVAGNFLIAAGVGSAAAYVETVAEPTTHVAAIMMTIAVALPQFAAFCLTTSLAAHAWLKATETRYEAY